MESRRSTAAQFFMEEDAAPETQSVSSTDRVVELLNGTQLGTSEQVKVDNLRKVQEIIVHKEPNLLDNFLDEMLSFHHDRSTEVRKFVVGFIEEACKKDNDVLPKVVANLQMLVHDPVVAVQKKVLQCAPQLYKTTLSWLCKAKTITSVMESTWAMICQIKRYIVEQVDSDNDGVRSLAVKFAEMVVLMQTYPESDSTKKPNEFSLDDVPLTLKIARPRKLEEEARAVFEGMVRFHGSPHITSANLMTCMGSLTNIALLRPAFMGKVVVALEMLHANLPPTLGKSQVRSVRKHLKLKLLSLLKHPLSFDYYNNITTLLTDLGATQQEVMKSLPKSELLKKRPKQQDKSDLGRPSKRARIEEEEDDDDDEDEPEPVAQPEKEAPAAKQTDSVLDAMEQFILEHLNPQIAADLVMHSMPRLPETLPPQFSSMYTPIAAAGTAGQIKHVARLLAAQMTSAGIGPGLENKGGLPSSMVFDDDDDDDEPVHNTIATVVGGSVKDEKDEIEKPVLLPSGVGIKTKHKIRTLKLNEITRPLASNMSKRLLLSAVNRILHSEKNAIIGGATVFRNKMLASLGAQMDMDTKETIMEFILSDIRSRCDLAFGWLYEEYSYIQGFKAPSVTMDIKHDEDSYDTVFSGFVRGFVERTEPKDREILLHRLYLEAPLITENSVNLLRNMCSVESQYDIAVHLLKELVIRRPTKQQLLFLNTLLECSSHEYYELRTQAVEAVVDLYSRKELKNVVEDYAITYLKFLRLDKPPAMLFGDERGRPTVIGTWNEDVVKACLYLYLALLPVNEKLIHELAQVYVQTNADVKRTILRLVEQPVKGMGMDSPELLRLVETCPKGAETLVTRVMHILTDKTPPSSELVARVRDLYHKRVSDVRFLIPVLNGLTKQEVIAALPKLIKLNPVVVREVFNRLLGTHVDMAIADRSHSSPLTPAELLVALHNIDPSQCDIKTVISATALCLGEKQVYTQEVLAVVMQQLMDQNPLPTLLMRTVIQSLTRYPRLIGFVMNILQRLILKQVWRHKRVWEGFIKCCQRTKPQSFQVLIQLPPAQLQEVFDQSPELREPLQAHVDTFTDNQRAHIAQAVLDVISGTVRPSFEADTAMDEPPSPSDLTIDIKEPESEEIKKEESIAET